MSDKAATEIGPYRLQELLGRGGMGAVYAALDERLGRRVAVKHVPPAASGDAVRRRRFRHEAATLARLSHPAIVQIFDVVETAGGDWIVMELVDGPSVAELVAKGPLPLAQALAVGRRVAEGLAEAHAHGILHRDLKAENVMLNHAGHAKILDFGLAKALWGEAGEPALSRSGQILGTPRAMSPEQARGLPLDARSDLFALGVLLYEMATAAAPFSDATALDTLTRITSHPHVPAQARRAEIPAGLSELIDRLLEKSPEHRPASARVVAAALADLEAGLPADGRPVPARNPAAALGREGEPTVDFEPGAPLARPIAVPEGDGEATDSRGEPGTGSAGYGTLGWRRHGRGLLLALVLIAVLAAALGRETWRSWLAPALPVARTAAGAAEPDSYALFQQGMGYLERSDKPGHLERAIAAFEAALALDENSAPAYAGLALAYRQQYVDHRDPLRLRQAVAVVERAVQLDEHLALARVASGMIYAEAGRYDEALLELGVALQLDPSSAEAYRGLGMVHQGQGKAEEAMAAYQKAVELSPRDRSLRDVLGTAYYRSARYGDAEREFLASIELAPDGVYGYRNLAAVYYMQGRLKEAAATLQQALEIRPAHSLYANLGGIFFAQGLYQPSVGAFEKALEHGGANIYVYWANLADAHRLLEGHEQQAREAYGQAIKLLMPELEAQPESSLLHSRLVVYRAKGGDCEQAVSDLEQLAPRSGLQAEDRFRMAVAFEVCGRRDQALAALDEALGAGYPRQEVAGDPDLFDLRLDPRYHRRLAQPSGG